MHIRWMRRGLLALLLTPAVLAAQTDYYNTDAGRPVLIEDALPTERYAWELQLAPLRLERASGGIYSWGLEPEIAYGILPRTQIEVGVPIVYRDPANSAGIAGVEIAALHNLNAETAGLPALAVAAEATLPVGAFAPAGVYPSVKGIATRTFSFARFHLNGSYTFGSEPDAGDDSVEEISRWLAGIAIDKAFPLRSLLLVGDVYARQPIHQDEDVELNLGAGVRYQLSPQFNVDAGIGRTLTGANPSTFVTIGAAYAFAVRSLISGI